MALNYPLLWKQWTLVWVPRRVAGISKVALARTSSWIYHTSIQGLSVSEKEHLINHSTVLIEYNSSCGRSTWVVPWWYSEPSDGTWGHHCCGDSGLWSGCPDVSLDHPRSPWTEHRPEFIDFWPFTTWRLDVPGWWPAGQLLGRYLRDRKYGPD